MKRLLILAALLVAASCGGDGATDDQSYSDAEIAEMTEQLAERYDTSEAVVSSFVGQFASAGDADLDHGAILAAMLDLPMSEYPEIHEAAGQAAWQVLMDQR